MSVIKLVKNDTRPTLCFTCKEEDGIVIDLTASTVRFAFRKANADACKFKETCVITDAVNGICEYSWHNTDLNEKGDYVGEVEITFPDNKVQTSKRIYFKIREELG